MWDGWFHVWGGATCGTWVSAPSAPSLCSCPAEPIWILVVNPYPSTIGSWRMLFCNILQVWRRNFREEECMARDCDWVSLPAELWGYVMCAVQTEAGGAVWLGVQWRRTTLSTCHRWTTSAAQTLDVVSVTDRQTHRHNQYQQFSQYLGDTRHVMLTI